MQSPSKMFSKCPRSKMFPGDTVTPRVTCQFYIARHVFDIDHKKRWTQWASLSNSTGNCNSTRNHLHKHTAYFLTINHYNSLCTVTGNKKFS